MRETIQRKLRSVEDAKTDTEQQKETLKSQIVALERGEEEYNIILHTNNLTDSCVVTLTLCLSYSYLN